MREHYLTLGLTGISKKEKIKVIIVLVIKVILVLVVSYCSILPFLQSNDDKEQPWQQHVMTQKV